MSSLFALLLLSGSALVPDPPKPPPLRSYRPPQLEPEPAFVPSETRVVKIVPAGNEMDEVVLARPRYPSPMVGHVARGAHIAVRGELSFETAPGCPSKLFYALEPFGWICSTRTRVSDEPATVEPVLQVAEEQSLPFKYVMVMVPEGESIPMWSSLTALRSGQEPERKLERGDTVAVQPGVQRHAGASYYLSVDGKVAPVKGTYVMPELSQWQGVTIDAQTHLPFGWTRQKVSVYDAPGGKKFDSVEKRQRVDIVEEKRVAGVRWLNLGEGRWVKGSQVNEVRALSRPKSTLGNRQWFDVDLGEQVVTAYVDETPVYATLISSGKEPNHTPRGNYPIWGKVAAITMKSQEYDDKPYYVNKVPWVLFFQAHNALHGAYWHDVFGNEKSHGCANLAPRDARYLFEWLEPKLPAGWTSVRYPDLTQAPVAHVRNSAQTRSVFQERNIGPPHKDDEANRLGQALAKREAQAQEEAARLAALPSGDSTTAPVALGTGAAPGVVAAGPMPVGPAMSDVAVRPQALPSVSVPPPAPLSSELAPAQSHMAP
jgi:hypothetical protein